LCSTRENHLVNRDVTAMKRYVPTRTADGPLRHPAQQAVGKSVLLEAQYRPHARSVAVRGEVWVNIDLALDQAISELRLGEREHFEQAVYEADEIRATSQFTRLQSSFPDHRGTEPTPEEMSVARSTCLMTTRNCE